MAMTIPNQVLQIVCWNYAGLHANSSFSIVKHCTVCMTRDTAIYLFIGRSGASPHG